MFIDGIVLFAFFLMAVYGYRKGFIHQVIALAATVCVVLFASPLAEIAEKVLANEFQIVLPGARLRFLLVGACGAVIFIFFSLVGAFVHKTLIRGIKFAEKTDRVLGMTVGIVECVVVVYVALCLVALGKDKVETYVPAAIPYLTASTVYRVIEENNALKELNVMDRVFVPAKLRKA